MLTNNNKTCTSFNFVPTAWGISAFSTFIFAMESIDEAIHPIGNLTWPDGSLLKTSRRAWCWVLLEWQWSKYCSRCYKNNSVHSSHVFDAKPITLSHCFLPFLDNFGFSFFWMHLYDTDLLCFTFSVFSTPLNVFDIHYIYIYIHCIICSHNLILVKRNDQSWHNKIYSINLLLLC